MWQRLVCWTRSIRFLCNGRPNRTPNQATTVKALLLRSHHHAHTLPPETSLTLRLLSYIYGAPILDVSRSHTRRRTTSVGLLWTSDQLVTETSTWQHTALTTDKYPCPLRPLTCWDRGFESHRGHGYLAVVSVVCCQVEVSATSWSLVQRSPTDCAASLCVI